MRTMRTIMEKDMNGLKALREALKWLEINMGDRLDDLVYGGKNTIKKQAKAKIATIVDDTVAAVSEAMGKEGLSEWGEIEDGVKESIEEMIDDRMESLTRVMLKEMGSLVASVKKELGESLKYAIKHQK